MAGRLAVVVLWTLVAMMVQAVMLVLPGRGKERFARLYWQGVISVLGLRLTLVGAVCTQRPVIYVANHSSWLDIVALGSVLPGCFVAKGDIARWPVISCVAKLGRTIFVSRTRIGVGAERDELVRRLAVGDNIILFPEGTTSDGSRILPFSASFLALAMAPSQPRVQPVTIVYDEIEGLPVRRRDRPLIAWYGDMDMATHYLRIGRVRRYHATIKLDAPIPPGSFPDRKVLAAALEARLAHNAAAMRQGREV